jgi:hypothetical protein
MHFRGGLWPSVSLAPPQKVFVPVNNHQLSWTKSLAPPQKVLVSVADVNNHQLSWTKRKQTRRCRCEIPSNLSRLGLFSLGYI